MTLLSAFRSTRLLPVLLLGLLACSKPGPEINPGDSPTPGNPANPGVPTEVGKPIGAPVSQSIGPAGGTISTADGRITVRFPAGALTAATTIQLQTVTQTAPVETESPSIALLPADLVLKKAVEVSYSKSRTGGRKAGPETEDTGAWIAQQRSDNTWAVNTAAIRETATEVTVQVTNMGYFTLFYPYVIQPKNLSSRGMLVPNEPVQLLVRRNFVSSAGASGPVILKPLSQTRPEELLIASDAIDKATVNGQEMGSVRDGLLAINYNTAKGYTMQYTAPQRLPQQAPVRVTAYFMTPESGHRTATTTLSVGNDCRFTFKGNTLSDAVAMGSIVNGGLSVSIQDASGGYSLGFQLSGTGTSGYPFKYLVNMVNAGNLTMFGEIYHQSYSLPTGDLIDNSGTVTITAYEPVKGFPEKHYVRGTVSGRLSKPYDCGDKTCWEHEPVEASFAFVF